MEHPDENIKPEEKQIGSPKTTRADRNGEGSSNVDPELDALLDSALEDFGKPVPKKENVSSSGVVNVLPGSQPASQPTESLGSELEDLEKAMLSMLEEGPLKEHMQKFAEAAAAGGGADNKNDDPLSASIADALRGIAQSTQSLSENPSEEELAKVLQNLCFSGGAEGGEGSLPDLIPLVQNVMQSLLSKDLLYPALKDIVDKYPDWLAEKRPTIEEKKFELYNRQYELMKQVCDEYNSESATDSEETKKLRFDRISKLMQSIQECGNPPKELIGDVGGDFDADLFKNKLGEKDCSVM